MDNENGAPSNLNSTPGVPASPGPDPQVVVPDQSSDVPEATPPAKPLDVQVTPDLTITDADFDALYNHHAPQEQTNLINPTTPPLAGSQTPDFTAPVVNNVDSSVESADASPPLGQVISPAGAPVDVPEQEDNGDSQGELTISKDPVEPTPEPHPAPPIPPSTDQQPPSSINIRQE